MRPILSTVSLHHHSWPEVLDQARQSGFTDIELLMIPGWVHVQPGTLPVSELTQAFQARRLRLVGIHAGGIDGGSDAALESSVDYIRCVVEYAGAASASFVNINGMAVAPGTSSAQREQMLARIIQGLQSLRQACRSRKVVLTLENHVHCHIETLEDYQAIFRAFPLPEHDWLAATIDTGHFMAAGIAPDRAATVLAERVHHVHIKDHREGRSVELGTGEIDNLGCIRVLQAAGYTGCLSAELELGDAQAERHACALALPYLQRLITTVQETA